MAVAFVQSTGIQTGTAVSSDSASFSGTPVVNNHVFLGISGWDNDLTAIGTASVTDNQTPANTYTENKELTNLSYDIFASLYSSKVVTASGTFTVTITFTASNTYTAWSAVEFSGLDTSTWLDQSGSAESATGDASITASGANTTASGLALAVTVVNNSDTDINIGDTPPSGYTNISVYEDSQNVIGHSFVYKIYSGSETSAATWTHDNTSQTGWVAVIATYKAAGGGGGGAAGPLLDGHLVKRGILAGRLVR